MKPDHPIKRFFAQFRHEPPLEPESQTAPESKNHINTEPTWKDRALSDFKTWLDDLPEDRALSGHAASPGLTDDGEEVMGCDLYTLLTEFAALRQEIKLQNREQHAALRTHESLVENMRDAITLFQKAGRDVSTLEERIRAAAEIETVERFLDVRDALSRGLTAGKTGLAHVFFFRQSSRERLEGVVEGYEMALRRFDRILSRFNIAPFSALGKPFDPSCMRAVGRRKDAAQADGIVLEEEMGGFMLGDRVLRPAEVIVNG